MCMSRTLKLDDVCRNMKVYGKKLSSRTRLKDLRDNIMLYDKHNVLKVNPHI